MGEAEKADKSELSQSENLLCLLSFTVHLHSRGAHGRSWQLDWEVKFSAPLLSCLA